MEQKVPDGEDGEESFWFADKTVPGKRERDHDNVPSKKSAFQWI
jgi:hypothetical protein